MSAITLEAEKREGTGKGAARALRREGRVPAIIYGSGDGEVNISLERKELVKQLSKGGLTSKIVELNLGGEKIKTLPRDVQFNPVTDVPEHADFLRVNKDSVINVWVKVVFEGKEKCPGIKKGGVLNVVRHQVELFCKPDNIPESLVVDIRGLNIGESVHIEEIELGDGVKPTIDRNFTVATIAGRVKEEDLSAPVAGAVADEDGEEGEAAEADGEEEASEE